MELHNVIERLRQIPDAQIDTGHRQGRDAVLEQLQLRTGRDESQVVDKDIEEMRKLIEDLRRRAAPYEVPRDYVAFLEYYGGMRLYNYPYNLMVFGVGPMAEEWYRSIICEDVIYEIGEIGLLSVGELGFEEGHPLSHEQVEFLLDLAGRVQKHCVIGVGPWSGEPTSIEILQNLQTYQGKWRKVADSFTDWLGQAVTTRGAFLHGS